MISNTEQLGQQIREQYAPQDNRSFTSTLMRFAVSQVSEYVFKEVIEPLTEQLSTNALSGTRVDQKLDDIDKHIIELGEKFKSLTFYPSPQQHTHSIRTDTNYVTQPSNNSRMANEFRLLHELKQDYQQIKERTTSNLVAGGFRELNSPIIESAITKSIEYYKKYKASKESRTSSSDSSNQTANSTFTSSTSDIVSLLMQRQEDNEDDRTETQENELLDAINKELKLDTKLLKQIERNTANISLNNASSNGGGLLSSVSDIAGNLLGGKGDKIKNLGKSGMAKAGGLLSRGGTALAGIASSISLPLLAAGSAAVIGGGTGLSAIIKGIQGDDASNWISNGVDGTLSKITGKDTSLGTMIYDMFHSDDEQLNNIVLKPNSSSALESNVHSAQTSSSNTMNTNDTAVSNTSSNNQFSTSSNNHSLSTNSNVHNANTSSSTDNQSSTNLTDTNSAMSTNANNQFSTSSNNHSLSTNSNVHNANTSSSTDNQFSTSTSNTMSSSLSEQTINSITADNVSSLSINADSKMLNISPSHINDERTISSIEHNIVEKEQHKEPIIINNTQPQQQVNTQPPNRGQDVVPVITRSNYSSLSRVSDSMIGISLRG